MKSENLNEEKELQESHLLRGAPYVRTWSIHQRSVPEWALCGRKRTRRKDEAGNWKPGLWPPATEDENAVTCQYCIMLMGTVKEPFKTGGAAR